MCFSGTEGKMIICHQDPIPRFTRTFSLGIWELCKDSTKTQCAIPWEKRSGDSVLWVLSTISVVNLIKWICTIRWFSSKSGKQFVSLWKLESWEYLLLYNERNEPVCFSGRFEATAFELSQLENTSLAIRPQCGSSQKHVSLHFQNFVRTPLYLHCTIPREEGLGENVLWVLTAIPVVTLSRWICTFKWLPSNKWQVTCFFLKTKTFTKFVVLMKREINQLAFLAGLRLQLSRSH